MDWFSKWPKDALIAVSGHFLNNFNIVATPDVKLQLIHTMGVVHDNVAQTCVDYFQRCFFFLSHVFIFALIKVFPI